MTNIAATMWRALRDLIARKRAEIAERRAEVTRRRADLNLQSPRVETARVLQEWLDCARDDVRREQAELIREREEVARLNAEVTRERAENDHVRAEVEQLRLDNRALLNSLLGTAGIPPLPLLNSAEVPRTGAETPAVRRPSWPQIAAKREIAIARKAESSRKQQQADSKP